MCHHALRFLCSRAPCATPNFCRSNSRFIGYKSELVNVYIRECRSHVPTPRMDRALGETMEAFTSSVSGSTLDMYFNCALVLIMHPLQLEFVGRRRENYRRKAEHRHSFQEPTRSGRRWMHAELAFAFIPTRTLAWLHVGHIIKGHQSAQEVREAPAVASRQRLTWQPPSTWYQSVCDCCVDGIDWQGSV